MTCLAGVRGRHELGPGRLRRSPVCADVPGLEWPSMAGTGGDETSLRAGFRLAEWLVQPDLNRLTRGERSVQLEPRLMDVLVFLARRPGEVISKDELIEGVWKLKFISEWAITRAIAKLRRALGDDVHEPRFIATISKRGYRLVAPVGRLQAETRPPMAAVPTPPLAAGPAAATRPFAVGQWVRAERFYGRTAQLTEILHGNRDSLWVLGTRCVGKTSLLRQLEYLTANSTEPGYFPLFWDLQGAEDVQGLTRHLCDAVVEAAPRFSSAGLDAAALAGDDLFASLADLRRALAAQGLKLLLLCDEAEELIRLHETSPALIRKLRRTLHSQEGMRTVLAAGSRLWALAMPSGDTSPFLHGFTPPVYLGPLTDDEATMLIRQSQLAAEARPALGVDAVERIRTSCGNHPYLVQLLGSRLQASGNLEAAIEEVAGEEAVSTLFAVDVALLDDDQRQILSELAGRPARGDDAGGRVGAARPGSLQQLERLGLIRRLGNDRYDIPNAFLLRWLRWRADS